MQQLIILIVALALAGGVYLFLTISKKKNKEQTEENAVEMMTANEMINVKDIRNNCLHTAKVTYIFRDCLRYIKRKHSAALKIWQKVTQADLITI